MYIYEYVYMYIIYIYTQACVPVRIEPQSGSRYLRIPCFRPGHVVVHCGDYGLRQAHQLSSQLRWDSQDPRDRDRLSSEKSVSSARLPGDVKIAIDGHGSGQFSH